MKELEPIIISIADDNESGIAFDLCVDQFLCHMALGITSKHKQMSYEDLVKAIEWLHKKLKSGIIDFKDEYEKAAIKPSKETH